MTSDACAAAVSRSPGLPPGVAGAWLALADAVWLPCAWEGVCGLDVDGDDGACVELDWLGLDCAGLVCVGRLADGTCGDAEAVRLCCADGAL